MKERNPFFVNKEVKIMKDIIETQKQIICLQEKIFIGRKINGYKLGQAIIWGLVFVYIAFFPLEINGNIFLGILWIGIMGLSIFLFQLLLGEALLGDYK